MNDHTERQGEHHEPPSADEMLAYSRGQLSEERAAEVWARLQQYPDLAAIYTAPFPADGGDYVSDEQLDARWEEVRGRLGIPARGRIVWFPRLLSAAAAIAILTLGGLLWQSQQRVDDLETRLGTPLVLANEHQLRPDGHYRGPAAEPNVVRSDTDAKLVFEARGNYSQYEVEIRDIGTTPHRTVRERTRLVPAGTDIEVGLRRGGLKPGRYQVVLYGDTRQLDTFTFEVMP